MQLCASSPLSHRHSPQSSHTIFHGEICKEKEAVAIGNMIKGPT